MDEQSGKSEEDKVRSTGTGKSGVEKLVSE